MSEEQNVALLRRWFEEGFNKKNLSVAEEVFAAEYIHHTAGSDLDLAGFKERRSQYFQADPRARILDVIAVGDKVVFRLVYSVRQVALPALSVARFAEGKCVEAWELWASPNTPAQGRWSKE